MKRITDPDFKYTPAVATDIRETFARIRREAMPRTCHDLLPGESFPTTPLDSETVWTLGD